MPHCRNPSSLFPNRHRVAISSTAFVGAASPVAHVASC
ncbi:pollen-specific leucine-rich repeat extensin-like protein 4 [Iris pallida]|uniref:Pollen-specific leucine-rich repeat extensin-like protein 4 n=1 Tax=Iris pallida TaxID=29817 RepID=A0AAX6H6Q2_IRIPA|nr:pollen-specific leucine-rich repeat extensin-like protein 4 [Iris pallida]KAJ6812378.1 pollen-specific leucine-rich repeat extensin-like protein 4 [Iris pallida]KAJ6836666.1 pollen-specific leucine-rich repeat extensin-like protein 4 [Iris pallida]